MSFGFGLLKCGSGLSQSLPVSVCDYWVVVVSVHLIVLAVVLSL